MNPAGAWNNQAERPFRYGDTDTTYQKALEFLDGPGWIVEDWGCGGGWARQFVTLGQYRGVDVNPGPGTDVVADLRAWRSAVDSILLRHVLEHNPEWRVVLGNAVRSAQRRLCIVLFTPMTDTTRVHHMFENGIVDISFRLDDLLELLPLGVRMEHVDGPGTIYGVETVIYYPAFGTLGGGA